MRRADVRLQALLGQRPFNTADEIAAIGVGIGVLELAPAAFGKVAARRFLVMRAGRKRPVVEQCISRHSERNMAAA